mgnify:FL=1
MDTPRITIWGTSTPRSFRPLWMAEELGIHYEHKPIRPRTGETQTPEYQQLNRKQKIPFLQDGDVKLSESLAICRYLRDQYPSEQVLTPQDIVTKAKEDEWCCYIYGELDETSLYVMRRHGDLGMIYGESETTVNASRAYAEKHFEVVGQLLEKRTYLVGDQFGLADVFLMSCIDWANAYQVALPDSLHAYHAHIAERPAYMRAMKLNYPDLFGGN